MPRERRLFAVALTAARALGGQGFGLPLGPVVGSGNALHHSSDALVVGGVLAANGLMHRAAIRPVTDVPPENPRDFTRPEHPIPGYGHHRHVQAPHPASMPPPPPDGACHGLFSTIPHLLDTRLLHLGTPVFSAPESPEMPGSLVSGRSSTRPTAPRLNLSRPPGTMGTELVLGFPLGYASY